MSTKQRKLLWPALIAAGVTFMGILFVSAGPRSAVYEVRATDSSKVVPDDHSSTATAADAVASARPAPASQQREVSYVPNYRVWVHRDGFRPDVIHARPGRIILDAKNETGQEVFLVIERVTEQGRAQEIAARIGIAGNRKRSKQALELAVGEYVFYDESRPTLRGTIVVEPPQR